MATKSSEETMLETVLIIDVATGSETIRELNADEIAQKEKDAAQSAADLAAAEAKAAARQSALAKLAAIGLTPEEIEAL